MRQTKTELKGEILKVEDEVNGRQVEVTLSFYPGKKPQLFAIAEGRVIMSLSGPIAQSKFKKLKDGTKVLQAS